MSRLSLTAVLAVVTAGLTLHAETNAAAKAAAGAEAGFPPRENMRATALKQFDKDGDGKLSDEERKAMQAEFQKRNPQAAARMQEMMKKFDKDGDGKLNDEERKAAMEARAAAPGKAIPAK